MGGCQLLGPASHIEAAEPSVGGGGASVDEPYDGALGKLGPEGEA